MIGEVIGDKYKIVAPLAESHIYEVFKAQEIATGATVVIKLLKEEMAVNADRVKCFCDEIQSFASMSHPLIAAILDIDMYDDRPYVVTELVDGQDLHFWIKNEILPFDEAIKIIQDLATVLQYAAEQNVEYRTIKLSNVLRNHKGKLKVLSFTRPRLRLAGRKSNTDNSGLHSDLFFLGTTFFELLAGEPPIRKRGGINELWDTKLESLLRIRHSALTPEQIEKIVAFIRRTLTREMKNRFESYEEFLKSIADLAGSAKSNSIKQKTCQLSMASEVVDALNGRMSNINTAIPKILPRPAVTKLQATPAKIAGQAGNELEAKVAKIVDGNLALDDNQTANIVSITDKIPTFKSSKRQNLKLLKNEVSVSKNWVWKDAEENHWLKSPLILIGSSLLVMILLILFW